MKQSLKVAVFLAVLAGFAGFSVTSAHALQTFKGRALEVNHPEGWTTEEHADQVNIYRGNKNAEWVQIDITTPEAFQSLTGVDIRQADALEQILAANAKHAPGFKLVESQKISTDTRQGYSYIFTFEARQGGKTIRGKQAVMDFIEGGRVCTMQFVASPDVFEAHWNSVKVIFDSVDVVE
jgi:hypothetical protein